jgi:hypothetical protein
LWQILQRVFSKYAKAVVPGAPRSIASSLPGTRPGPSLVRERRDAPPSPEGGGAGNSRSTAPRPRNGSPVPRRPCWVGEGFAEVELVFLYDSAALKPPHSPLSGGSGALLGACQRPYLLF